MPCLETDTPSHLSSLPGLWAIILIAGALFGVVTVVVLLLTSPTVPDGIARPFIPEEDANDTDPQSGESEPPTPEPGASQDAQ